MNRCPLRFPVLAVLLSSTLQLAHGQPAGAPGDPKLSQPNQVVTVAIEDHRISGLVTHLRDTKAFKRGDACQAFTAHGFVGIESETVAAMRSWVKTGTVPRDVERQAVRRQRRLP